MEQSKEIQSDLMGCAELSREKGIPQGTIHSWIHRRQIPFYRFGKRLVKFSRREIDQWIRSCHVPTTKK